MAKNKQMELAIEILEQNLNIIASVRQWGELMGYKNPRKFSLWFIRKYSTPPSKVLIKKRLLSIREMLSMNQKLHREVALRHAMRDAKDLDNFVRRHLNIAPGQLKYMSPRELLDRLGK